MIQKPENGNKKDIISVDLEHESFVFVASFASISTFIKLK